VTQLELNKATATAALSPQARHAHRQILTTFTETGRPPSRTSLTRFAPDELHELGERDVVAFDEHGELRAAYPFSPTETGITVTWAGGPIVHAMCAIDALGMSAMLGRPVVITATEPDSGEIVVVDVDGEAATWIPDTAVVYAGATDDCCPSVDGTCGNINFFTTTDAAHAWANRHPDVTGEVLAQRTALTCGITEFGALLRDVGMTRTSAGGHDS
jgi:hypothetical protein